MVILVLNHKKIAQSKMKIFCCKFLISVYIFFSIPNILEINQSSSIKYTNSSKNILGQVPHLHEHTSTDTLSPSLYHSPPLSPSLVQIAAVKKTAAQGFILLIPNRIWPLSLRAWPSSSATPSSCWTNTRTIVLPPPRSSPSPPASLPTVLCDATPW